MTNRIKLIAGGVVLGIALFALGLTAGTSYAQIARGSLAASPSETITHDQMREMMDAMHGPGTSQRMHEAMGPEAEKIMDECVAMMGMMHQMHGTMGGGMPGMTNGMNGESMRDMMNRMMGH